MKLTPILMAGGGGTRLWPLSREHYPKQFLELFEKTLFQKPTARRKLNLCDIVSVFHLYS